MKFEYPFVLAPLAGITDRSMRSLCSSAGASLTYTEMVSAKGLWYGDRKTGELLTVGPEEGPVGFQLFGSEPEILAYAVRILSDPSHAKAVDAQYARLFSETSAGGQAEEGTALTFASRPPMGARTAEGLAPPALFDLNAGCPVPKIVKNGEGSALLKDPDLLYKCVSAMCDAAKEVAGELRRSAIPVTVKIRKGFEQDDDCAVEIARAAEAAGAAAITVHGRTRQQFYDGKADWSAIARVKAAVRIPVIGNGDVMTGADAIRMMEETGCDGVMIARGALGNPWIFRDACQRWDELRGAQEAGQGPVPGDRERISLLLHHMDLVCADKGERVAVREMRKHIGWYIRGMHGATRVRREINSINDLEEVKRVLRSLV